MPRAVHHPSKKPPARQAAQPRGGIGERLMQAAFFLSLVLVIVRMTMPQMFRGDTAPIPGATAAPAIPGPTTALALDLLCCLPALLVLARRLIDSNFTLRRCASHLIMLLLAAWTVASVFWAADKFAAVVAASNWAAAIVLLWSTSQIVRQWVHLRILAAAAFGLLLVLLVQGYYYRLVDLPDFQRNWREHQAELLKERDVAPDSREAIQIGKNIQSGEVSGFSISRNTYAALLVLLMTVTAGVVLQRIADGDGVGWIAAPVAGITAGLVMLYCFVQSKTAFVTPVLAVLLLWLIWARRDWMARHARGIYWSALAMFGVGTAAVVGHGMKHGSLPGASLTFRWQYWVGAARVFVHHPWLGVGWANFGPSYLAHRLPQAAEEPIDPHNFLVRAFVELGVIGGVLMVGWMLRLWWELTAGARAGAIEGHARVDASESEPARRSALPGRGQSSTGVVYPSVLRFLVTLALVAAVSNLLISQDWSAGWAWVVVELFKRLLFLIALLAGMVAVAVRSMNRQDLDDRPAPWVLVAILVGLGLFLLHNLIDFSMFEPGAMFLFALLAGGALALRMTDRPIRDSGRAGVLAIFIAAGVAWLVAGGAGVLTVGQAEALAQDADADLRAGNPAAGEQKLIEAFRLLPINADYAYRAEQAALGANGKPLLMRQLLDAAIAADPLGVRYRRARAELEISTGDLPAAWIDYQQALQLDPNNVEVRLEYATELSEHGRRAEARQQFEKAMELNSRLAPDEIKRLPEKRVRQIQAQIKALTMP